MASDTPPPDGPPPNQPGPQPYPEPTPLPYPSYPGAPYPGYPGYPPQQPYGVPPAPRQGGVPWYVWLIGGCLVVVLLVGVACVALGLAAGRFFSVVAHQTPASTTSSQTFTVTGAPTLVIHDSAGQVTVNTGSVGNVTVQVTKIAHDTSATAAQRDLDSIQFTATQTGNTINVDAQFDQAFSFSRQLTADLDITVPATANLTVRVETGTVQIEGVSGLISATVTTGTFAAHDVTLADGSRVDMTTGDATVVGALAAGAKLITIRVTTGNADLTLPASTSAHLDAATSVGNIAISGWSIPVTHSGPGATAAGDMIANPSGTLSVHVSTGNITLTAGG
jgi:hypothetical protein